MKKIGVVGEGLVGSCFKGKSDYHVVHRDEWDAHIFNWSGIVNCCAIAGAARCDAAGFDAVNRANVVLPREMAYMARNLDIPFITFSTSAVYARPSGNYPVDESSPLYPHNLYASSKITMEAVMPENAFIFRIPIVITGSGAPNDFPQKVQGWKVVEDVDISIIFGGTIVDAVSRVMTGGREDERTGRREDGTNALITNHESRITNHIAPGIYNLAAESVHLPTFIKEVYGWEGEVVEAGSLGLSPAIVFDVSKAAGAGLI